MRKLLIIFLIILLVILGVVVVTKGLNIGPFEVLSYSGIVDKNANLEVKLIEASQLTSVTFPEKTSSLTKASKQLETMREQYQDKIAYSNEEDIKRAKEVKNYQVDFLFTRLGNYVKKHGIDMDLKAVSASADKEYDLNFVLHGKYALISEFIRDIENDSQLNFIIEKFKLTPGLVSTNITNSNSETKEENTTYNGEILKAEFVVTAIRLEVDESINGTSNNIYIPNEQNNMKNNENTQEQQNTENNTNKQTVDNTVQ